MQIESDIKFQSLDIFRIVDIHKDSAVRRVRKRVRACAWQAQHQNIAEVNVRKKLNRWCELQSEKETVAGGVFGHRKPYLKSIVPGIVAS